jgi:hypothetical protein
MTDAFFCVRFSFGDSVSIVHGSSCESIIIPGRLITGAITSSPSDFLKEATTGTPGNFGYMSRTPSATRNALCA